MKRSLFQIFFLTALFAFGVVCADAQIDASTRDGNPRREELPKAIKENLAKGRIDQEKKEYEELLKRADEASRLSEELDKSFAQNNKLTGDDLKKLERLEKQGSGHGPTMPQNASDENRVSLDAAPAGRRYRQRRSVEGA